MNQASRNGSEARLRNLMSRYLGSDAMDAFADDDVTEIYVNPQDHELRFDTHSRGKVKAGQALSEAKIEQFLNAVATYHKVTLNAQTAELQAELPAADFGGARLQGFLPPLSDAACFVIRKRATKLFPLASYVENGIMSAGQSEAIQSAITEHENILVAGGTNSGKTTLCNAIIGKITEQFPEERVVILEDTGELQCAAADHLQLQTSEEYSLSDLVKSTLRTSPDRIIVGEVRDESALYMLDAWATGHPGGCCTVHATTPEGALLRLNRLARRAGVPSQVDLIAEAVGLVVLIEGGNRGRFVKHVSAVEGVTPRGTFEVKSTAEPLPEVQ